MALAAGAGCAGNEGVGAGAAPAVVDAQPDDAAGNDGGVGADTSGVGSRAPTLAVQFANTVIDRWPDPRTITGVARGWDYNNGIVLRGMMEVFKKTNDARYLAYIKQYVDGFVDDAGNLFVDAAHARRIQDQAFSLDVIQPANLLLFLAEQFPADTRYQTAATAVHDMFATFPVNGDGGFWHKQTYPNEMWLDGIYMAEPFLARYGAAHAACGSACNDTPVQQATLLASRVRLDSGLLLHGWDYDHNAAWCTGPCAGLSGSGLSPEVWSRSLGWFAMALIDILEVLPAAHPGRASLVELLSGVAAGAASTQDSATGLWCQVVDKCSDPGNWTESSGSAMLVYALKHGVDRGYLDAGYLSVALRAWEGLETNKIGSDAVGPVINDSADGTSIQPTYAAYVGIVRKANSYHGLCAIQLAAAAMEY